MAAGVAKQTLPHGWTSHQDETSGATYYYHARSGVSQWELPGRLERLETMGTGRAEAALVCFFVVLALGGFLGALGGRFRVARKRC